MPNPPSACREVLEIELYEYLLNDVRTCDPADPRHNKEIVALMFRSAAFGKISAEMHTRLCDILAERTSHLSPQ